MDISEFDLNNLFTHTHTHNYFTDLRIAIIEGGELYTKKKNLINKITKVFTSVSSSQCIVAIAPTNKITKLYDDIIPQTFIHDEYKEEIISRILYRQKIIMYKKIINPTTLLIMDDCITSSKFFNSNEIKTLFFEAKCYRLSWILTIRHPFDIPPLRMCNFDLIFFLDNNSLYLKKIYDYYAGMFECFEHFDNFKNTLSKAIDKYGCIVIVNKKIYYINLNHLN